MNVFFTNDVEHTSVTGSTWERIAEQVNQVTLPRLLDLYDKYDVKSTFFVLGELAELCPNIVKQIVSHGQEVGSHGYQHNRNRTFDVMSLDDQIKELKHSKELLEQIGGQEVVSFRAPALRVNSHTPQALCEAGYKFDSSVAPQRLDAFMSYGAKEKRKWLKAPRTIYQTAFDNLARRGDCEIIEVPVSAFGVPYIGTVMRIAPKILLPMTRNMLYVEACMHDIPVNFLFHPSEAVREIEEEMTADTTAKNGLKHILSHQLRAKMKMKNLNIHALDLLECEIQFWYKHHANFMQIRNACISNKK